MASSSNSKTGFHARPNSFPSRPNPVISLLDDHLCRLRASEDASTSSSFGGKLSSLQDLHDCISKVLLLQLIQQAMAQENNEKWVDELLDGSLQVLDLCNSAKDALLQTKECLHGLQLILRRRGCGEIDQTSEVKKYLTSRKVVKKGNSQGLEEVQATSLNVFESLLSFISGPKTKSAGWSLVSKLVHPKKVPSAEEETGINEFAEVDAALLSLVDHNTCKSDSIKGVQSQLENLELCIQDLEEVLEGLISHLIEARVSLLNILNH
ncbi:unnamed protein product [Dovyalis caffra]|uniref:Uncharacterized protein n=1 Tax=Dovyalis caffra TaxID=77055 RepID=A0AAV1RA50_9ROSI|nr:unnamed protein product [Dovyalis caffra]